MSNEIYFHFSFTTKIEKWIFENEFLLGKLSNRNLSVRINRIINRTYNYEIELNETIIEFYNL